MIRFSQKKLKVFLVFANSFCGMICVGSKETLGLLASDKSCLNWVDQFDLPIDCDFACSLLPIFGIHKFHLRNFCHQKLLPKLWYRGNFSIPTPWNLPWKAIVAILNCPSASVPLVGAEFVFFSTGFHWLGWYHFFWIIQFETSVF